MFSGNRLNAKMSSTEEQESSDESSSECELPPKKRCVYKLTTPLHEAIKDGDEYFIKKMFHYKCELDINTLDSICLTPLILAILKKEDKIANIFSIKMLFHVCVKKFDLQTKYLNTTIYICYLKQNMYEL